MVIRSMSTWGGHQSKYTSELITTRAAPIRWIVSYMVSTPTGGRAIMVSTAVISTVAPSPAISSMAPAEAAIEDENGCEKTSRR
jgi:hypothetical protein